MYFLTLTLTLIHTFCTGLYCLYIFTYTQTKQVHVSLRKKVIHSTNIAYPDLASLLSISYSIC